MGFFSNLFGGGGGGDYWSGVARELQKVQNIQSQIQGAQAGSGGLPQTAQTNVTALPISQGYYQQAWERSLAAANQPFQQYGTKASDFVAQLTPQQRAAISDISATKGLADPYYKRASSLGRESAQAYRSALESAQPLYGQAAGLTSEAAQGMRDALSAADPYYQRSSNLLGRGSREVGALTSEDIAKYISPYMSQVIDPTRQALQQQQAQQLQQQQSEAIRGGAFGGDRVGLGRAQLRGQQELAMGQALAPLFQTGYGQALQTAQQQQAVQEANRQRMLAAASQYGGLGTARMQAGLGAAQGILGAGTQSMNLGTANLQGGLGVGQGLLSAAGLQGGLGTSTLDSALKAAQAQFGAGTLQQQTAQAGKQALYNQFLQQRAYPFQTAQFLTGAATGMGPLYGQATSGYTQQPAFGNILSDRRAKGGVAGDPSDEPEVIGKTFDGQNIYRYRYKDGGAPQIGLMADEVEHYHPDAVGESQGYQTVDYRRATDDSADLAQGLGAARMGGAVTDGGDYSRGGYAVGGVPSIESILAQHRAAFGLGADMPAYGPSGSSYVSGPAKGGIVPTTQIQPSRGLTASTIEKTEKESSLADKLGTVSKLDKELFSPDQNDPGLFSKEGTGTHIYDYAKGFFKEKAGGGGLTDVKGAEYFPEEVLQGVKEAEQLKASKQSGSQQGQGGQGSGMLGDIASTVGDIGKIAGGLSSLGSLASAAAPTVMSGLSGIGSALSAAGPAALAMFSDPDLKTGVGRKGYATEGGVRPNILPEEDYMARTMLKEDPSHMEEIGHVMLNRLTAGRYGKSIAEVATAPKQFSPWNEEMRGTKADPRLINPSSPEYERALGASRRVLSGESEDPTGGATHFYNPKIASPKWGSGMSDAIQIGEHLYGKADAGADRGLGVKIPTDPRSRSFMASAKELEGRVPQGGVRPAEAAPAEESLTDKLLSRQTIVPLLTGIGAMASSPSRYLGPAILQGLGAGAKSYMDVGKQIEEQKKIGAETGLLGAQTGAQKAGTIETLGRAAKASLVMGPNNMPIAATIYDPKTGGYRYMDFGELYRNRNSVNLLPGEISMIEQAAKDQGVEGATKEPTGVKQSVAAPEAPKPIEIEKPVEIPTTKPPEGALTPVPQIFSLGGEDKKKVGEQLNTLVGTDISGQEKFFREQEDRQKGAATQKPLSFELAAAFSNLPKTGPLAPGALQPKVANIAEYINSLGRMAGKEGIINKSDLATLDQIKKLTAQLKTAATAANDQTAVRALDEFEQMFPTGKATPQGIAKNLAAILMMNQKDLDKIHYFDDWKKTAASINPTLAAASGSMANTAFNEKYNAMYDREMRSIEKMLMTDMNVGGKPVIDEETGRPMNWFSYVAKHGGDLSNKEKALIEKSFGQGILRYFTPVQR